MFRIIIAYICSVILLTGCQSPLEKSVLEPLTTKQLDKVAKEDKSFLATYSIVEEKWNYITSPADSARWRGVTYARLHNYLNTIKSAEINSPLFKKLRSDWEDSYAKSSNQVDSIVSLWKNYLSSNSPDSLVSVLFSGVELEKFRNSKKEIDTLVKVKVKIKRLKFPLDSLSLLYGFSLDSCAVDTALVSNDTLNSIKYNRRISDSIITKVYPTLLPAVKKSLINSDTLLKFDVEVQAVYANGKCYNADTLKKDVPSAVLALIESETDLNDPMFDSNFYRENIIRQEINPAFVSQSAYIKLNAEDFYRELDSLVFNYINYRGEL